MHENEKGCPYLDHSEVNLSMKRKRLDVTPWIPAPGFLYHMSLPVECPQNPTSRRIPGTGLIYYSKQTLVTTRASEELIQNARFLPVKNALDFHIQKVHLYPVVKSRSFIPHKFLYFSLGDCWWSRHLVQERNSTLFVPNEEKKHWQWKKVSAWLCGLCFQILQGIAARSPTGRLAVTTGRRRCVVDWVCEQPASHRPTLGFQYRHDRHRPNHSHWLDSRSRYSLAMVSARPSGSLKILRLTVPILRSEHPCNPLGQSGFRNCLRNMLSNANTRWHYRWAQNAAGLRAS